VVQTQLSHLGLQDAVRMTDQGFENLSHMTALQSLNLAHCSLTSQGLEHLRKLARLQHLDLSACRKQTVLEHLSGLRALQYIGLTGCVRLTDQGVEGLSSLTELQTLGLMTT
jgi:Leucine-rich repeat (LRR) protein